MTATTTIITIDCGNDNDDYYSDDSDNNNEDENGDVKDFWVLEASVPQLMTGSLLPPSSGLESYQPTK